MTPQSAREAIHRAAVALPDGAAILVARLLDLGTPGTREVLGTSDMVTDNGAAAWDKGMRSNPAATGRTFLRSTAFELWGLLGRYRG